MFWKFNHGPSPHIETLLNKEDVTLHEIMDEEDVLQECKVQNKKLIEYLVRPDVMEELVTLTTVEPSGEVDERARYKYPNIACELLTCDVPALNERLAGDEALLGKLYAFLESDKPLNPLLASFFSKTIGVLVARKSEQNWYSYQFTCLQVLEFLKSKENCISLLLKHLGTSAIMDLMLKLITHVEGVEMKQNILNWLDSQRVVQCLVALLDPAVDPERHCNAAQLLCDVIKMSRENQHTSAERTDPDPILNTLESPETVKQLLDHILGKEKSESSIVGGISVLLTLLDFSKPSVPSADSSNIYGGGGVGVGGGGGGGQGEEIAGSAENEQPSKVVLSTASAVLPRLKDFHNLLLDPPHKPPVKTTAGTLDPPFGNTRLQVAKLFAALVATNNAEINRELANLGTIEVLLDLFFKYTWNNFLHSQVEQCIAFALNSELSLCVASETSERVLLKNIFLKCKLIQRVLDAWDDNEVQQAKTGGLRKGYMGHLIKIANHIAQQAEKGPLGSFIKEHVAADTVAAWEAFVANTLAETNKTHQICLGGAHPVHSSSEDDDAEYRDIPFSQDPALQQVFSDYQMQQMAPQFIENYGFHDDEFTDGEDTLHASVDRLTSMTFSLSEDDLDRQAELFKQVCAQKLHTLNDGEEDIWDDREQELTFQTVIDTRNREWHGEDAAGNSSSDEEERAGPEGREEVHMEVDSTDREYSWAAADLSSEGAVAPIAVDASNPWGNNSEPTPALGPTAPDEGGWADFDSAGFADFEANFGAAGVTDISSNISTSNCKSSHQETEKTESNVTNSTSLAESSSKTVVPETGSSTETGSAGGPPDQDSKLTSEIKTQEKNMPEKGPDLGSDDNANPSASIGEDHQQLLIDNYRFLSAQGLMASSSGQGEVLSSSQQRETEPVSKENGPVQEAAKSTTEPVDNSQSASISKQSEASSSQSCLGATPNGPV
ncbi:serine/threonine-protein phosphatase 6 regulatory subunit 3 isoform X2 [Periplaneta americana]|uniref:serine/threonine-protein phosphatase 6 regulatory subunit 3 isoform X2 n=1 Tax=Periplaneta americana TaxID=6978 RepID=UPI0037E74AD1